MKCRLCGADSSVAATRAFREVFLRRTRVCFNGHGFKTFEVHTGNLDTRTLETTKAGVLSRAKSWLTKQRILNSAGSAVELAQSLGVSESYVRLVRKSK